MKTIQDPNRPAPTRPYSPGVIADGWLHLAGQVPVDDEGHTVGTGLPEQAQQVLRNISRCLEVAGAAPSDIVSTVVYLTDIRDIDALDEAYRQFFPGPRYPARTTVGVNALARPEFCVEITTVVRLPESGVAG
jgi:2-iminobutanoate/2-iminopropanoate deaminase